VCLVVLVLGLSVLTGSPASAATTPPCGDTIYKSDGTPWTCTFDDEFNGTRLDTTKWYVQETATSSFSPGGECFVNSANNVSVSSGQLHLTLRKGINKTCSDPKGDFKTQWTSGSVSTYNLFSQAFGRFEFRATFPDSRKAGQQSSLWMWPTTNKYGPWPYSGEIDVAEWYGKYWDRAIPFLHYGGQYTDPDATNNYCLLQVGVPHTFLLEWSATGITISYDGKVCLHNTRWFTGVYGTAPFDQPFMLALSQLLGTGDNKPVIGSPTTSAMKVDYVRVWS
jgi:beta-glucanase (GH16 family)